MNTNRGELLLLSNEAPLGGYTNCCSNGTKSFSSISSASFDNSDFSTSISILSPSSLHCKHGTNPDTCTANNFQLRRGSLSYSDDINVHRKVDAHRSHFLPNGDFGALSTKIDLLRRKACDIESQLDTCAQEQRALIDQKAEIDKTLALLVQPGVETIVRRRDSMDPGLLQPGRWEGGHCSVTVKSTDVTDVMIEESSTSKSELDNDRYDRSILARLFFLDLSSELSDEKFHRTITREGDAQSDKDANPSESLSLHTGNRDDGGICASDHLFLSDEIHTSSSIQRIATDQSQVRLDTFNKIDQRRRRATISFDTTSGVTTATNKEETDPKNIPLSEEDADAIARIKLRKAQRVAAASHTQSVAIESHTQSLHRNAEHENGIDRRPSLWGGLLDALRSEVIHQLPEECYDHRTCRRRLSGSGVSPERCKAPTCNHRKKASRHSS